jgi:hypothetical protein
MDEARQHPACKAVKEHGCFGSTERSAGKQLECPALFRAKKTFSRGSRHVFLGDRINLQDVAMARSALKRPPARIADPDTDHVYRPAARTRDDLAPRHCQSFIEEAADRGALESMGKDKPLLHDTVRKIGK